ncbi:MAG: sodium-translocating pyrophosphatase, partial [Candidatus Freyarchaeota archaeon]
KGADVGADLVGKVEAGIPEDDPRNPAVIADLVGDNVGDVAGMGADLFESYVGSALAAMLIGAIVLKEYGERGIVFPLIILAMGIFSTIFGVIMVRAPKGTHPQQAINRGVIAMGVIATLATFFLVKGAFGELNLFYAVMLGLVVTLLLSFITQYYTLPGNPPVIEVAKASRTGPATTVISGLALGMRSVTLPIMVACVAILLAHWAAGVYGIAIATIGMNLVTGMIISMDAYGPIVDNAGGIAEMSGSDPEVRETTDILDSVGNTTKAICKGFAISDCTFETIALFLVYMYHAGIETITLTKPPVIIGILTGAALAFLFSSFCLQAVGTTAFRMVEEVRRQFREIPGLLEGKAKPDYASCVDISTKSALKNLLVPGALAISTPLAVGFILGPEAVGGLLIGNIACALALGMMMAHAGTAWDNAKKLIETGFLGGKGTPTHAAAVIGDTIGDPFKDTAGPSLDVLMTILSTISILFAELFTKHALLF